MPNVSPRTRIDLYRAIARYWRAGISPLQIGAHLGSGARDAWTRGVAQALCDGKALDDALRAVTAPSATDELHLQVIGAAHRSGRIPETLDELADDEEREIGVRRQLLAKAAYPLLVFHVAMFVMGPAAVVTGNFGALIVPLLVTLGIDGALYFVYRALFFPTSSPIVDRIVLAVPLLGAIRATSDLRRYLAATNHLYEAGIGLPDALRAAANGLRRPLLQARLASALATIPPETDPFGHIGLTFPRHAFVQASLHTGFVAGDLSNAIRHVERPLADDEQSGTRRFVMLVSGALFAAAAVLVASIAIRFYGGLFAQLR